MINYDKIGIRMENVIQQLEPIIANYVKDKNEVVYLELGTAHCFTFRNIYDIIKENIKTNNWLCLGVDLKNSLDVNFSQINKVFNINCLDLLVNNGDNNEEIVNKIATGEYHASLILRDNPREYLKSLDNNSLDIVFIDANHNYFNVFNDFISIENKVKNGGLVFFHDSGEIESGTDFQGKDENGNDTFIDVRRAITDLGLYNNNRIGWKFITELKGTRKSKEDNGSNSLAIFQKI